MDHTLLAVVIFDFIVLPLNRSNQKLFVWLLAILLCSPIIQYLFSILKFRVEKWAEGWRKRICFLLWLSNTIVI